MSAAVLRGLASGLWLTVLMGCSSQDLTEKRASSAPDAGSGVPETACAATSGSVPDGWPCNCGADCGEGALCEPERGSGWPGGMCTKLCNVGDDSLCDQGSGCVDLGVEASYCGVKCRDNADCPPHGYCDDGFCLSLCFADTDCQSNHCDVYRGVCSPMAAAQSGGGVYAACVRDDECRSRNCGSTSGRCLTTCSLQDGRCPEGGVCVQSAGDIHGDLGFCFPACTAEGTCNDPTLSCGATGIPQDELACMPNGSSRQCHGQQAVPDTDYLSCGCADDCSFGAGCATEAASGAPGGVCVRHCSPPDGTPCGVGYTCSSGICLRGCEVDADCGARGRVCDRGRCFSFCSTDADCETGHCDAYSGLCQPTPESGAAMGAACQTSSDCKSANCDTNAHYCWALCRLSAQGCPDHAVCAQASPNSDLGICTPPCSRDDDCRPFGLHCRETVGAPVGTDSHCE